MPFPVQQGGLRAGVVRHTPKVTCGGEPELVGAATGPAAGREDVPGNDQQPRERVGRQLGAAAPRDEEGLLDDVVALVGAGMPTGVGTDSWCIVAEECLDARGGRAIAGRWGDARIRWMSHTQYCPHPPRTSQPRSISLGMASVPLRAAWHWFLRSAGHWFLRAQAAGHPCCRVHLFPAPLLAERWQMHGMTPPALAYSSHLPSLGVDGWPGVGGEVPRALAMPSPLAPLSGPPPRREMANARYDALTLAHSSHLPSLAVGGWPGVDPRPSRKVRVCRLGWPSRKVRVCRMG